MSAPAGGFAGFPEEALTFYEGLEADPSKAYWTDHRAVYEGSVKAPLLALLDDLAPEFGPGSVFRPYRDVRFSRDKSPYKTAAAASVGALYLQLSAAGLMVAGGYYDTAPDQVERLRLAVDDERSGTALVAVVEALESGGWTVGGQQLKTVPRGFDRDHPRLRLLRHRTLVASRSWQPEPWLHEALCREQVATALRGLAPLTGWLEAHVGPSRLPVRGRG